VHRLVPEGRGHGVVPPAEFTSAPLLRMASPRAFHPRSAAWIQGSIRSRSPGGGSLVPGLACAASSPEASQRSGSSLAPDASPLALALPPAAPAAPRLCRSALGSAAAAADARRWGGVGHRSSSSDEPQELRAAMALLGPRLRLMLPVLPGPVGPGTAPRTSRPGT